MKTINIMRGYTGLQAFFPSISDNVQEIAPQTSVKPASVSADVSTYKPRLLSQRTARRARRLSH